MQKTLRSTIRFTGVGLHSGQPVRMIIEPASADYGIWFRRTDVLDGDAMIAARWENVEQTQQKKADFAAESNLRFLRSPPPLFKTSTTAKLFKAWIVYSAFL